MTCCCEDAKSGKGRCLSGDRLPFLATLSLAWRSASGTRQQHEAVMLDSRPACCDCRSPSLSLPPCACLSGWLLRCGVCRRWDTVETRPERSRVNRGSVVASSIPVVWGQHNGWVAWDKPWKRWCNGWSVGGAIGRDRWDIMDWTAHGQRTRGGLRAESLGQNDWVSLELRLALGTGGLVWLKRDEEGEKTETESTEGLPRSGCIDD